MLIMNVLDIGPLSAGLFFSPLSGIIAGTVGSTERILAGELWNLGRFTSLLRQRIAGGRKNSVSDK